MGALRTFLGPLWYWAAWSVVGVVALAGGLAAASLVYLATALTIHVWYPKLCAGVGVLGVYGVCRTLDRLHLLPRHAEQEPVTLSLNDYSVPTDTDIWAAEQSDRHSSHT